MKRLKTFLVTSFLLICATSFSIAETKQTEEKDFYEYNNLVKDYITRELAMI